MKSASSIRAQLVSQLNSMGYKVELSAKRPKEYLNKIKKSIVSAFFMQTAHLERAGHYMTLKDNQIVMIHPSTAIDHKPEWVVYHEFVLTSKNYIRTVSEINPKWLLQISPEYFDLDEFSNNEIKKKLLKIQKKLLNNDSEEDD
jgi:pre-mRNA-splicing factor ATP-dependent RNA helicase DHX15/PRP43